MRKFYLENHRGQRLNLNNTKNFYLVNPTGLGASCNFAFSTSGNGFFSTTDKTKNQINVVAEIAIMKGYAGFTTLMNFINRAEPLTLVYAPNGKTEYYADVECEYLTKTELVSGILICPVSFRGLELWRLVKPNEFLIRPPKTVPMPTIYPFSYDYQYYTLTGDDSIIYASGHIDAALEIKVKGKIVNPVIELRKSNTGELVGTMRLKNLTVPASGTLKFSSRYGGRSGVWLGNQDITNKIDLTTSTFFRMPPNTPCRLTITGDESDDMDIRVDVYNYFDAV